MPSLLTRVKKRDKCGFLNNKVTTMTAKNQTIYGELPERDTYTNVSGANTDLSSDQHRSFGLARVIGYSSGKEFICLQRDNCWPTVERVSNCYFRTDDVKEGRTDHVNCFSGYWAMLDAGLQPLFDQRGQAVRHAQASNAS